MNILRYETINILKEVEDRIQDDTIDKYGVIEYIDEAIGLLELDKINKRGQCD